MNSPQSELPETVGPLTAEAGTALEALKREWANVPYKRASDNFVLGDVRLNAKILLVGEAPGQDEDETGKAFTGQAGERLNDVLAKVGLDRKDVSLFNVFPRRPEKNRKPTADEIAAHKPFVEHLMYLHKNRQAVGLMGGTALQWATGQEKIESYRGWEFNEIKGTTSGVWYVPMFHPAAVLYQQSNLKWLLQDMRWLKTLAEDARVWDVSSEDFEFTTGGAALERLGRKIATASSLTYVDVETAAPEGVSPLWWWDPRVQPVLVSLAWLENGEPRAVVVEWNDESRKMLRGILMSTHKLGGSNALYFDFPLLRRLGIPLQWDRAYLDSYPIARLNDENRGCGLKDLAKQHFQIVGHVSYWGEGQQETWQSRWHEWPTMSQAEKEERIRYSGLDAYIGIKVLQKEIEQLTAPLKRAYKGIIIPQAQAVEEMNATGLPLDMEAAQQEMSHLESQVITETLRLRELVPADARPLKKHTRSVKKQLVVEYKPIEDINFMSWAQMSHVLFKGAGLPSVKKTKKTDADSSDEEVLLKLLDRERKNTHPAWVFDVIRGTLGIREAVKAHGYIESLVKTAGASHDGRVHSTFKIWPVTWRLACVPMEAEILTLDGWKRWDQLTVGEDVVGYDILMDCLLPTELKAVFRSRGPVGRLSLRHGPTRSITIRCTPNHHWVARTEKVRGFAEAQHAYKVHGSGYKLILASPASADWPSLGDSISPTEAAIIGWAFTDGHIHEVSPRRYRLQIQVRKPSSIQALDRLLARIPHSRSVCPKRQSVLFSLPTTTFTPMLWRVLEAGSLCHYVLRLPAACRDAMWSAMMEANGSTRLYGGGRPYERFGAAKQSVIDAFHTLAVLQGKALRYRWCKGNGATGFKRKPFMDIEVSGPSQHPRWVEEDHEAEVWCPQTGTGTWIMRLDGMVCITGNSEKPNCQQLPGSEAKHPVKPLFVAPEGWRFVKFDHSTLEVRGLADQSGDSRLIARIRRDLDLHWVHATGFLGWDYDATYTVRKEGENKLIRFAFKLLFFASAYGAGDKRIATAIRSEFWNAGIGPDLVLKILAERGITPDPDDDAYLVLAGEWKKWLLGQWTGSQMIEGEYPGLRKSFRRFGVPFDPNDYKAQDFPVYLAGGIVTGKFGIHRRCPEIRDFDNAFSSEAHRQLYNFTPQNLSLLTFLSWRRLREEREMFGLEGKVFLCAQEHDSMLFLVQQEVADFWAALVKDAMETIDWTEWDTSFAVPLKAEGEITQRWG